MWPLSAAGHGLVADPPHGGRDRAALEALGLKVPVKPDGAFYLYCDVGHMTNDSDQFCRRMLDEAGVSISGLGYYPNPLAADLAEAKVYTDHLKKVIAAAPKLRVALLQVDPTSGAAVDELQRLSREVCTAEGAGTAGGGTARSSSGSEAPSWPKACWP